MNGICLTWSRGRLISPSLPVGDDRYLNLSSQKRPTGRNLGLGVLLAHAQVPSNSSSYHIRGNEMNWVGSSDYMTPFARASFLNMLADQSSIWLIRISFPKSTTL